MKAAVLYEAKKPLKIEEFQLDEPGPGEVLVRLIASGVCHSDWHVVKGEWPMIKLPCILGHEGAGIVEQLGPNVNSVKKGDHVILSWKPACGTCEACESGWPNLCDRWLKPTSRPRNQAGTPVDQMSFLGTFAEYTVVPEAAAVSIPKDVPFAQASLVGCGVMTGVGAALNTARVQPGATVAVFGCGGVGLNCIQGARIAGATTIIAVDLLDNKLDLGREFGATHTVNASRENPVDRIRALTDGKGAHYAFEAIGLVEAPFVQSVHCTRRKGVTVWVGHAPVNTRVTLDARDLLLEKSIVASFYGSARPHVDFPRLLTLYKAKKLMLDELVSERMPLSDVNKAFDLLGKGSVARSVLDCQ
ncbi:MAG: Zn-dependent alcohol dehydrogenase [Chloroflexi bacterium]|nr:Zn-dependent alcohol dehydrogenase [Chloroflexota bacterium]